MLHQPSETFKPAGPAPSFDPKRYIARARELGLTIFPTFMHSGLTYGLTTADGHGFSGPNLTLAREFASAIEATPDATSRVFHVLCDDFGVDPNEPDFNERVSVLCRRKEQRRQGDRKLLAACRKAKDVAVADKRATNRLSELEDSFMVSEDKLPRPTADGICEFYRHLSAKEARAQARTNRGDHTPKQVQEIGAYIELVATWEKDLAAARDAHGVTAANRASHNAGVKTRNAIASLAAMEATTAAGLAAKSQVMLACIEAGYGYDSQFEEFAHSILLDAARLGDARNDGEVERRGQGGGSEPCAQ